MGREALEGLRFLASLPLAGTGQREGGGFSCINKRINSHPVTDLPSRTNPLFESFILSERGEYHLTSAGWYLTSHLFAPAAAAASQSSTYGHDSALSGCAF